MNYNNIKGNKTCSHHLRQRTRRCARGALPRVLQCRDLVRCGVRAWRRQHEALLPCSPARTRTHGDASMRTHTLLKTRTQAQQGNAHPLTRPADLRSHAYWQASSRARRPARTCARNHRDPTGEHFLEFVPLTKLRPIFLPGRRDSTVYAPKKTMLRLVVGLLLVAAAKVRACLLGDLCADVRRPLPAASKPAAK